MSDVVEFTPHSDKQEEVILSDSPITIAGTGTQWGKTQSGGLWMKRYLHQFTDPYDNFIITAPTYKILQQSTLPAFKKVMEGYGAYKEDKAFYKMHHGGTVFCRTATDPDSVVGVTNVRAIWADEAGKYSLYFWENIQARADFFGCPILLTTSPYSLNWIYKDLIKPAQRGLRPDVKLIQAASWENPYHSLHQPEKRQLKQATMDPRRFNMIYGGEWGKMVGLVYDCFDEDENQVDPFQLPSGTKYYCGVDWGFTEAFAMTVLAITPDDRRYVVSEFYKSGLSPSLMVEAAKQKKKVFDIQTFYCDPSQPGMIQEFNTAGLSAVAADNDIMRGVGALWANFKSRRLKLFKGAAPYLLDEIEVYHYPDPDDLGPDDNAKEQKPVQQNDHSLDSLRYVNIMTVRTGLKLTPKVPEESQKGSLANETYEQRMKRLTRRKSGGNKQTENWD